MAKAARRAEVVKDLSARRLSLLAELIASANFTTKPSEAAFMRAKEDGMS